MTRLVVAELLKLRTTRSFRGVVLAVFGLILLIVVVAMAASDLSSNFSTEEQQRDLFNLAGLVGIFAVCLGVMNMGGEDAQGTITSTFLVTPSRPRVMAAKVIASALVGFGLGLAATALTAVVAMPWLKSAGVAVQLQAGDLLSVTLGVMLYGGLFAALGVGVGALTRSSTWGIVAVLVWLLILESVLGATLPDVVKFAPGDAGLALSESGGEDSLSQGAAAAVLLGWSALLLAAGTIATERRDIT